MNDKLEWLIDQLDEIECEISDCEGVILELKTRIAGKKDEALTIKRTIDNFKALKQ